jgi:hypothetical protein
VNQVNYCRRMRHFYLQMLINCSGLSLIHPTVQLTELPIIFGRLNSYKCSIRELLSVFLFPSEHFSRDQIWTWIKGRKCEWALRCLLSAVPVLLNKPSLWSSETVTALLLAYLMRWPIFPFILWRGA